MCREYRNLLSQTTLLDRPTFLSIRPSRLLASQLFHLSLNFWIVILQAFSLPKEWMMIIVINNNNSNNNNNNNNN